MAASGRSRRRGNRTSSNQYSITIRFMAPPKLRERMDSAADLAGVSLSEWIRSACEAELRSETDYLDAEESRLTAELEEVKQAKAEKVRSEQEEDEKAWQEAREKYRKKTDLFDMTMEATLQMISPSVPARIAFHETGLADLLSLNREFLERIPEGELRTVAAKYLEE